MPAVDSSDGTIDARNTWRPGTTQPTDADRASRFPRGRRAEEEIQKEEGAEVTGGAYVLKEALQSSAGHYFVVNPFQSLIA